jgi:hypothetical protein
MIKMYKKLIGLFINLFITLYSVFHKIAKSYKLLYDAIVFEYIPIQTFDVLVVFLCRYLSHVTISQNDKLLFYLIGR